MRSARGVAAATTILLSFPLAVLASVLLDDRWAGTTIHFAVGAGFVLFAAAVFDFGLPRWATVLGSTSGAAFGGIFLLQGISELVHVQGLTWLAFDILGQQVERVLPDVVFIWFIALLLAGSSGLTRFAGWAIMPIIIGLEVAIAIGGIVGIDVPFIKLVLFAPFVWLLLESVKGRPTARIAGRYQPDRRAEAVSA